MEGMSPTGRDLRAAEELHLREQLRSLQESYRRDAQPYIDRLAEIANSKPVIVHLDLSQIEARVLAQLQSKVETIDAIIT